MIKSLLMTEAIIIFAVLLQLPSAKYYYMVYTVNVLFNHLMVPDGWLHIILKTIHSFHVPLSASAFTKTIRICATSLCFVAGVDPKEFGARSLRAGGAMALFYGG